MISFIRKLFPITHVAFLLACLYVADLFYPFTRQKITQTLTPYKQYITDWGNVFISIMLACALIGLSTAVIELLLYIIRSIWDYFRNDPYVYRSTDHSMIGIQFAGYGLAWVVISLLCFNYLHITKPIDFWIKKITEIGISLLPLVAKILPWIVYLAAILFFGYMLFGAIMIAWEKREAIQAKLKSVYEKITKKRAE